jgi:predicted MFS family arabinose efflux permease
MSTSELQPAIRFDRWAVASMFLVNGFVVGSWVPHIPGFVARLGIGEFGLGLLILGYGLSATVVMTLAGQMIARRGSGGTLRLFVVPLVAMLPLAMLVSEIWMAVCFLLLFGGIIGGMDVAMNANVVAVEKSHGRAMMSTSHGCWSLGGFAGGSLGGLGIQTFGAMQHALVVAVLTAVVIGLAFPHINDGGGEARGAARPRMSWPRQPGIYVLAGMALLCMCAEGAVMNWSALYLGKDLSADTAAIGFAFAGFSGAMALTRFFGDKIRDRFGAVVTFRWSCILAAAGLLMAGLSPSPLAAISAFVLAGIGAANLVPILLSSAGRQSGLNAGVGISVVTTIGHVGILLAPSLIGLAAGTIGLAQVYIAIALLLAAISVLSERTA